MMINDEEWKQISHHPSYYVSNTGKVKRLESEKCLYHILSKYAHVNLSDEKNNTQGYFIHRLVAEFFIPNPQNLPVVDHIDGNKLNNHVTNLRWSTQSDNTHNHYQKKPRLCTILQCDQKKNVVNIYNSLKEVYDANSDFNKSNLRKALTYKNTYKGFFWYHEEPDKHTNIQKKENVLTDDYVNINKPIKGKNFSHYAIHKYNQSVVNTLNNKHIKPIDNNGYLHIRLYNKDKAGDQLYIRLHKLVYVIFKDGDIDDIIDHIDGNRKNNSIENLENVTRKENTIKAKGNEICMMDMNGKELQTFRCASEACLHCNLPYKKGNSIRDSCLGRQKSAYGYKWKFI